MSFDDITSNIRERAEILKSQGTNARETSEDPKVKVASMQAQGERTPLSKIVQNSPTREQPPLPKRPTCSICNGQHESLKCSTFLEMTRDARVSKIVNMNLCFRCLSPEHISKFCPCPRPRCGTCTGPHLTVLHYDEGEYTPALAQTYNPAYGQQGNYNQGRRNYNSNNNNNYNNNNGNYHQAGATQPTTQATTTTEVTTPPPTTPPTEAASQA